MKKLACTLLLTLSPVFAEGTITWVDGFKVKHAGDPTDVVSYAQGPGPVHPGDTYPLNSKVGNKLFFWADYNPPLKLVSQNQIRITWSKVHDDGSEEESQNQEIGGFEPAHQPFYFIPYAIPGRFAMRIVLMPAGQVIAGPRYFNITQ